MSKLLTTQDMVKVIKQRDAIYNKDGDIIQIHEFKVPTFYEVDKNNKDLYTENYFDRDEMTKLLENTCYQYLYKYYDPCNYNYSNEEVIGIETDNFLTWENEMEFYIFNKKTGVCVNWYKFLHPGRANHCNKLDMTLKELEDFLQNLKKDFEESLS